LWVGEIRYETVVVYFNGVFYHYLLEFGAAISSPEALFRVRKLEMHPFKYQRLV
jgi:hypothetical protein